VVHSGVLPWHEPGVTRARHDLNSRGPARP
jgi:hypothetical protein